MTHRRCIQFGLPLTVVAFTLAVGPISSSQGDPDDSLMPMRIASYNAWLLPIGASSAEERSDLIGPAIDELQPNLVCLQEVWTVDLFEPVEAALATRLPNVATGGGGLVVLSSWPIHDVQFEAFPSCTASSFPEWLARKGILSMIVETSAGPVRVFNTHLTLDQSDDHENHTRQLAIVVEAVSEHTDLPTILCGDLNVRGFVGGFPTPGLASLLDLGFEDAANVAGPRQGTRVGWPRTGRRAHWDPDYILYRPANDTAVSALTFEQVFDTDETALSDHNLQLADLLFELP